MTWFTFSLLSIIALATAELTQQKILNTQGKLSERTSVILTLGLQIPLILILIFFSKLQFQIFDVFQNSQVLLYICVISLIGAFSNIFYFKSLNAKNISISTIFLSGSVLVSTLLGILFLNESLTIIKILGIALIMIAIVYLNLDQLKLELAHKYALLAAVLFGLSYTLEKTASIQVPTLIYMFWAWSLSSMVLFVSNPKTVVSNVKQSQIRDYYPVAISSLGYFLFNFFTLTAYKLGGEVGVVDAINNTQIFIIILVEYFIFKHSEGLWKKIVSAILAFAGVALLSYVS